MAVPIAVGADRQLEPGTPVALFQDATRQRREHQLRRARVEGAVRSRLRRRFLMNMTVEAATAPPITVVLNWDAALKK